MKHPVSITLISLLSLTLHACGGGGDDGGGDPNDPNSGNLDPNSFSINLIDDKTVNGGETLSFTVSANNPNSDSITFSTDGNQGTGVNPYSFGATFDPNSGVFSWEPDTDLTDDVYSVQFTVSNNDTQESDSDMVYIDLTSTLTYGTDLFATNCTTGNCHALEGQNTNYPLAGADPDQIQVALDNVSAMSSVGTFPMPELIAMSKYLCSWQGTICDYWSNQ